MFMKDLQEGNRDVHFGFNLEMPGCISRGLENISSRYVYALHHKEQDDKYEKLDIVLDGLNFLKSSLYFTL